MATLIGTVSKVIGQVFAQGADGTRRALVEGDRLFSGDQLVTGAEGAVAVHLQNGQELTLGRDSSLNMTPQLLANQAGHVNAAEAVTPSEATLTDVQQLQKAIVAGADPTQTGEATAAGPTATGTGAPGTLGGGHSFVMLQEVAGRVEPVIGFPTAGFNGIPEFEPERVAAVLHEGDDTPAVVPPVVEPPAVNHEVTLSGLSVEGGELTLNEANLPQGSANNPAALTQNGTFSVSAPDGLSSLNVGGISVVSGGVAAGFPQSITTALGNTLTITGYNPTTGVVSYSYTLVSNETHSAGDGTNNLSEHFTVVASDSNGDSATNSLDVNITDDVPKAANDSNDGVASESQLTLTGNVLTNDVQGADRVASGPITAGTFTGTYGTLVLHADGTYTYTVHATDPAFLALKGGGNGTESFTYTLTDADGDKSTANLVLNIHNNDDPVTLGGIKVEGSDLTVYEKNLLQGSAPDNAALTQSGTFTVTAPDGLKTLTVQGISVVSDGVTAGFPQSITTALGNTLTITGYNASTGVISYSYTLLQHETHPDGQGTNGLTESFTINAADSDTSTATATLHINIVDDVPTAANDSNDGVASESQLTLTGNVLTNDVQGADRVASGPITAGTFTGTYGTLVLAADGTYTYTVHATDPAFLALKGGGTGTESFTYTLTDADGDKSTANLVLNIHNNDDPVTLGGIKVEGSDLTVYEKNLLQGSAPDNAALTQSGTFTVTAPDGLKTLTVQGINVVSDGVTAGFPQSITTALGNTLTITGYNASTGVISYSYTLLQHEAHPDGQGTNGLTESFTINAADSDTSTATATLHINIVDDVPTAANDSNDGVASESQLTLTGNVLTNDVQGADRVASGPITAGTFTGTYGTLVLAADGTYTYTVHATDPAFLALKGGGTGTESFTYTLTDADGDKSTASLVLNIHNNDDPVTLGGIKVEGSDLTVYEKNLLQGSAPDNAALTQSGTFTVTAPDGLKTLTVQGISVVSDGVTAGFPQSITTALGNTLTITGYNASTGVISYSYTLLQHEAHPDGQGTNGLTESFTINAADSDTSTATATLHINIVDDVPTARADGGTVMEGATLNIAVLGNDTQGADGAVVIGVRGGGNTGSPAFGGLGSQIAGTYGYLTLDAAGNAVYHSNPNGVSPPDNATDTFVYTLRDADGDESTTTITIHVTDSGLKASVDNDVTVYEKALDLTKDGQDLAPGTVTGSDPGNTGETASGTLVGSVTGGSGGYTFELVGSANGTYGQIVINADGTYTYTLTKAPLTSPAGNDGVTTLNGADSFTYKATDALGNTTTSTILINIVDDVPKVVASDRSVTTTPIDTNLLLVIDISGSMNDGSGVPGGGSRLAFAKASLLALLDKYDALGDVKVKIVAFNGSATDKSGFWVDVATAKALIMSLVASGGTNYDAAVAAAKLAFLTAGAQDGAQNVGYFISDGKPTTGQEIGTSDEAAWKAFLEANNIKNYAIGLGTGVSNANLNPLAYDGTTHTDTNANIVTDLTQLNSVLSGTVVGIPVTGSLMEGGSFGADGGFIKTLVVDGITYTYDPKANNNQGGMTPSGGVSSGVFNTTDNSVTITTANGGRLVVNLDTGEYSYITQKIATSPITETFSFTVSDKDGDLAGSTLTVKVLPNTAPVAVDDHIITNVLSGTVVVPGELLLANDTDPNGDPLTASPTTFVTGWAAKGADFTGTGAISFAGTGNNAANQSLADVRNAFAGNTAAMTAVLVISGYLGAVTSLNANDEDLITVKLKAGETLNLDHNLAAGHITLEYSLNGGGFSPIADGGTITAATDGTYQIHVTNIVNTSGSNTSAAENYQLTMTVNYAGAHDLTTDYHGTYNASDNHGGNDSANVTISYQDGHTLTGTSGDDVLVAGNGDNLLNGGDGNDVLTAGTGNNEMHGGAGNDLLFSGIGNDILDGGTGIDTVSYAHATAGVTVSLALQGAAQSTGGAGLDTLSGIENLIGSNYNDVLTGDNTNNVINGGLGNDTLNGGGGDDILIGGMGNNTLTGGAGADTFLWQQGNSGHDRVTDFTPGTDKLDLSQLLQGENATASSLDDYLHFSISGSGANVVTTINVSALAGAAPTQTIDLAGVNLADHYGVTPGLGGQIASGHDTATIITGMLNDHSLKVDTV